MRPITLATGYSSALSLGCRSGVLALACLGLAVFGCGGASKATVSASASTAPPASGAAADPTSPPTAPPPAATAPPGFAPGWPTRTDFANPPATAQKTPSGLASQVVRPGNGAAKPSAYDQVRVHYSGWTADGKLFDSSVERGEPATFGVRQVIPGFGEALQLMAAGERRRVWIPAALAYGNEPSGSAPGGPLTFDIELLDVIQMPAPPPAPEDVKAPPPSAKRTKSGLSYRVLAEGTGVKPKVSDVVVVHYSGWTTDGKLFDSSVVRGEPATFPLQSVIKGWTEGVQLMKVGEKARFWIPGKLAYGDSPRAGAPAGTLVFDIELIGIEPARK